MHLVIGSLLLLALLAPTAARAQAEREAGVTAASNPAVQGTPPVSQVRELRVGVTVFERERVVSQPDGQAALLFRDGSSFTIGPNSDLVLDEFAYDPNTGKGQAALSLGRGVFRFVGGKLSKDGSVALTTPSAVLGVRGGIVLVEVEPAGATTATLLYGDALTVRSSTGEVVTVTRPGFSVTVPGRGMPPGPPGRLPRDRLRGSFDQLQGQAGRPGGLAAPPQPPTVAAALRAPITTTTTTTTSTTTTTAPSGSSPPPTQTQTSQPSSGQTQPQAGQTQTGQTTQSQPQPGQTQAAGARPGQSGSGLASPFAASSGGGPGGGMSGSPLQRVGGAGIGPGPGGMGPGMGPGGPGPGMGPPGMGPRGPGGPPPQQGKQRQLLAPPGQ
ncbi:MAG: FecR domain-containing protein [Proteobacteria bacterium]|nr:FecR domain-containing protein [Pseudomonadota bacterium]